MSSATRNTQSGNSFIICHACTTHGPVIVEMAELVSESLHVVGLESRSVVDDVEVCWGDCALTHGLTH